MIILRYSNVYFNFFINPNDAIIPDIIADDTIHDDAVPEFLYPILFNNGSKLAKYDVVVPYVNTIANIIFKYSLLLNNYFNTLK